MSSRGSINAKRSSRAVLAAACFSLLAAAPALAVGVQVGGVNLPGSSSVPGVSVQVPQVPGPQVNVPQVQVPDVANVGQTVDDVAPAVGQALPDDPGTSPSAPTDPGTPATPTTPTDGGPGGTTATGPTSSGGANGSAGGQLQGSDGGARGGAGAAPAGNGNGAANPAANGPATAAAGPADRAKKPKPDEERPATLATRIGDVISALPTGILVGLIGLAVLGLLMTGRSAWFARATRRLRIQRHALQEDVGVLQAALVPDLPPTVGGVGVAVAYRPAMGPAAGGDFHDVFEIDADTIGIVVGDVAGHGRDAVPRTGVVRYTIRAYLEAGLEPRLALRLADRALRADFAGQGEFATAIAATFDRTTSRLVYSCAGHPHPLVLGPDSPDSVEALNSPPIGVAGASGSRQTMLALGPDSELWFFSDGLPESRPGGGDMLGREGLRELIEGHRDPEELLGLLPSRDDLTACRLRVPAPEQVEPFSVETLLIERDYDPEGVSAFFGACGMAAPEARQALDRIAAESRYEGEILVRVSRLRSAQHVRVERIQPELGGAPSRVEEPERAAVPAAESA